MENENLPDENLEDEEEEKEDTTPVPVSSTTPPPTPAPSVPVESKGHALIEGSKASGEVKNRLTYKQRFERRERIKELLDKGITNAAKIAGLLGVTDVTVRKDISIITKERKTGLTRESAPEHVGTLLGQMEEIIKNSTMDYLNITGNDPKSNAAKASLLQTALRAIMAKSQLLMQTGVVPTDITTMDKIIEAQMIESKAKAILDPKIAEVVTNADSRRKVLDVVEKLRGVSPEVAAVVMERLDAKEEQDKIDKEHPSPEPPKETPQQPSPSEKPVA